MRQIAKPARPNVPHTFDGRWDISQIDLSVVYYLPKGRTPLPDWRDRVGYFAERLKLFHAREFAGQSELAVTIRPTPFPSTQTPEQLRGSDDQNGIYNRTMRDAAERENWPVVARPRGGFPILLVLSDINWRELDDFRRQRIVNGVATHEGHVNGGNGRHFPGAESGGARAQYFAREGYGRGLVSADGWRVPYSGSDCVVYHEGIGHPIGLPHPEPTDGSVMGVAQYNGWLHETFLNRAQKDKLGVASPKGFVPSPEQMLFAGLTALPDPLASRASAPVMLRFAWPRSTSQFVRQVTVQTQTALFGKWRTHAVLAIGTNQPLPEAITLGTFASETPLGYRVRVTAISGKVVELWGYFKVKKQK